ncbi:TPA: hypothetical protein KDY96_004032 [Vibrio parahaemolyticus]|nr:hypothetical protein [Vibrio parahaemolyticus]
MSGNSSNSRQKAKQRYVGIPHPIVKSEQFANLSPSATRLLFMILFQYNGSNNGNLVVTWKDYQDIAGVKSEKTFRAALDELVESGLLLRVGFGTTKRSRGKLPYLYAIAWLSIDETHNVNIKPRPPPLKMSEVKEAGWVKRFIKAIYKR